MDEIKYRLMKRALARATVMHDVNWVEDQWPDGRVCVSLWWNDEQGSTRIEHEIMDEIKS
jgi:hypothetical protein